MLHLAEAGLDKAIFELNKNGNWASSSEIFLGQGSFEATATSSGAGTDQKIIESIGYIPNKSAFIASRKIKATAYVNGEKSDFYYAVQSGNGGILLKNNARISGSAFTNGDLVCNGGNTISGDGMAAGIINTIAKCGIGKLAQQGATSSPMPDFNYAYWTTEAAKGGEHIGNLTVSNQLFGPKKIIGNLTMDGKVTSTGPIYVTGNLTTTNGTYLYLSNSFGSNGTTIVVDGSVDINNGTKVVKTNSTPSGHIQIVSVSSSTNINLSNTMEGGVFYSIYKDVVINNNAHPVALSAGNKIILENNAVLTYDSGLQSQIFSSGPGGGWDIKRGTWRMIK